MSHTPAKIGTLLRASNTFQQLRSELDRQALVAERVRSLVSEETSDHLIAARVIGVELVLYVDSPAWATRLRLQGPQLLERLNAGQVAAHRVRTRVLYVKQIAPRRAPARLSENARNALLETAKGTADAALKSALLRLCRLPVGPNTSDK